MGKEMEDIDHNGLLEDDSDLPEIPAELVEHTSDADIDLLANQTVVMSRHLLQQQAEQEEQQLSFIQFLRSISNPEQRLALANLYTDFELILFLQDNIDSLDENDPLGRQSLENSAKKTLLLLDTVSHILNHILLIKPEAHYLKETHRLRRNSPLPSDEYYRVKSPELDLIKAYTNFEQLKTLLLNSVYSRQTVDFIENLHTRFLPQLKDFLKAARRREPAGISVEFASGDLQPKIKHRTLSKEAINLLRQSVLSLTNIFLTSQAKDAASLVLTDELTHKIKDLYSALQEIPILSDKENPTIQQLQKLLEQILFKINRPSSAPTPNSSDPSFLLDFMEYLIQVSGMLDSFFESQSATRLEEAYFKRLELMRNTVKHLRMVIKEENYQEKLQLPFLNLKSYVYFAVKVIRDLNYFNPLLQRKYRYFIERTVIDDRLQQAFKQIPKDNKRERRFIVPVLLELNRLLRIASQVSPDKDQLTDYQLTYYWFKLMEDHLRSLIRFLKTYPSSEPLAERFDSISFTLEMEAERVFGKRGHLSQLNEHSPLEEYIKRVEDGLGILGRVLQENYLELAQAYLPNLRREDLDKTYKERINSAVLLREHTWCVWQVSAHAERQLKEYMENRSIMELTPFLKALLRRIQVYLTKFLPKVFYSDRIELKRTFTDLYNCAKLLVNRKSNITDQHLNQLHERIHVLTTLFASLAENVRNRSILEGRPFSEEAAKKVLKKYLQVVER